MSDILDQAKAIQRKAALDQKCWVTLAFVEDMIAEIERLETELEFHKGEQDGREAHAER